MAPHTFGTTEAVQIIDRDGLRTLSKSWKIQSQFIEAMYDGACYMFKLFGSRCARYPGCGDEWKTVEEAETTRHGPKIQNIVRWCGHILLNLSLPTVTSMVSEQSGRGQKA